MFGSIGKKIKNIFSKMIKRSKRDKIAFKKLDEYDNLIDEDNSYNKITEKLIEAIKEYDNTYLKQHEESSFKQSEIKIDQNIKSENEIIKEELIKEELIKEELIKEEDEIIKEEKIQQDYKKNIERILQNKVHRKDRHKKNNKYK